MTFTITDPTAAGSARGLPAVSLRGLTKDFGAVHAVRGIDLDIGQGEIVTFLGPNGAGKTSTIDLILGLSRPTSGAVEVLGQQPRQAIARGRDSPSPRRWPTRRAWSPAPPRSPRAAARRDRRHRRPSGRQVLGRRTAAPAIRDGAAPDPALLLLDEPTTGMDVEGRRAFWSAIRQDAKTGRTVLFATRYVEEADAYADRMILISRGQVVADGTSGEVKALAAAADAATAGRRSAGRACPSG